MRVHGNLSKWTDDRGFGFITPAQGSDEIFVHISAFPRDGVRPTVGELVSFEIEAGNDGYLNVTKGSVSQWERGEKKPDGAALKLINLVKNKGLKALA